MVENEKKDKLAVKWLLSPQECLDIQRVTVGMAKICLEVRSSMEKEGIYISDQLLLGLIGEAIDFLHKKGEDNDGS